MEKYSQRVLKMLVNLHDRRLVTATVAVVRCTENGNNVSILTPVIALHDELMRSCNQCQAVIVVECFRDVLAERVTCTSWTDAPATSIIRVTPEEIAHGTFVRNFLDSVERADVVEGIDAGRETTVKAEDLIVDESGEGKVVEQICEVFPNIGVAIFTQTFVVEAIDLCDLS